MICSNSVPNFRTRKKLFIKYLDLNPFNKILFLIVVFLLLLLLMVSAHIVYDVSNLDVIHCSEKHSYSIAFVLF